LKDGRFQRWNQTKNRFDYGIDVDSNSDFFTEKLKARVCITSREDLRKVDEELTKEQYEKQNHDNSNGKPYIAFKNWQ
jgi:hypothetical protein